ncbi:MAG: hypothetical protein NC347_02095 [Clostridium sp.]|nr:hypothetical protein [Clostridium sp.]
MFLRDSLEFKNKQKKHLEILMQEATGGITKRDILPNTAQPLQGEVEAMYFVELRHFFENSISRRIMNSRQDLYDGK